MNKIITIAAAALMAAAILAGCAEESTQPTATVTPTPVPPEEPSTEPSPTEVTFVPVSPSPEPEPSPEVYRHKPYDFTVSDPETGEDITLRVGELFEFANMLRRDEYGVTEYSASDEPGYMVVADFDRLVDEHYTKEGKAALFEWEPEPGLTEFERSGEDVLHLNFIYEFFDTTPLRCVVSYAADDEMKLWVEYDSTPRYRADYEYNYDNDGKPEKRYVHETATWRGYTDSYDWAEMTIKKVDGQWYIHDYPYPYTPMKLYYAIHYMDRENFNVSVRDADGVDISERIIELWYNVNYIYNVDATYPFLPVHREQLMPGHQWNPYQQMLNFDAVADMYFTKNGKSQLFETEVGLDGEDDDIKITFFHRLEDGTVWKHPSWKTGWSCAGGIADCTVKEMGKDRMVLSIEISSSVDDMGEDPSSFVPSFGWLEITIAKEDGQWKVDDYRYPD